MDLKLSSEEQLFQQEVRSWFEKTLPEDPAFRGGSIINMTRDEMAEWQAILNSNGWEPLAGPKNMAAPVGATRKKRFFRLKRHASMRPVNHLSA